MSKHIKILIIDDDPFLNKVYIKKFAQEGFIVLTAMDGVSGFKKIREHHPSLVVMDVVLPAMSGYEILREMKKDPAIKDVPVLIVSNLSQTKDVQEAMGLGAKDYLIKTSFTIDDILRKVREYISAHEVKQVDSDDSDVEQAQSRNKYPGSKMKLTATRNFDKANMPNDRCGRCGEPVLPDAHFCPNCGNEL